MSNNYIKEIRNNHLKIWCTNDIKQMALISIDAICTDVENGMNKEHAINMIFRFAHCAGYHSCYSVHDNWREELSKYFFKTFIKTGRL